VENLLIKNFKSEVTVRCGGYEYVAPNYKVYTFKDALAQMILTQDRVGCIKVGSDVTPAAGLVKYDLEGPYDPNVYTANVTYGIGNVWTRDIDEDGEFPILAADQGVDADNNYFITLRYDNHKEQWLREVYRKLFNPGKSIKVTPSSAPWDTFIIREVDDISVGGEYVIKMLFNNALFGAFVDAVVQPLKPQYGRGDYYAILSGKNGDVVSNVIYGPVANEQIQVNTTIAHSVNPGDSVYIHSTTNFSWEFTGTFTIDSIAVDRKSFVVTVPTAQFNQLVTNPSLLVVSGMRYTVGTDLDVTAVTSFTWFDSELSALEDSRDNTGTGLDYGEFGLFSESGLMLARFVIPAALTKTAGHHLSVLWRYTIEW